MIRAATLGGSWGTVPIRDIEDLPGEEGENDSQASLSRLAELR